jgi:hypothetical protein
MKRKEGYYWIDVGYDQGWEVGYYNAELDSWKITGDEQDWFPRLINESEIISPDEIILSTGQVTLIVKPAGTPQSINVSPLKFEK